MPLTKDDIKAFRKADYMVLRWEPDSPQASIELVKRATQPLEHNLTYSLTARATTHGHTLWTDRTEVLEIDEVCALVDFYHSQCTPASTIAGLLKAGDSISFEFWINNSELMDRAGLVSQYCQMTVRRPTKSGKDKVMRFDLFNRVGEISYPGTYKISQRTIEEQ